ncbi:MAG TPA: hypothetical protein VGC12_00295 [Methyloradius sp.]
MKKSNEECVAWGGARKGAGRPSTGRKQCKFFLTEDEHDQVKEFVKKLRAKND